MKAAKAPPREVELKCQPIEGENWLRWWVESRSDPTHPRLVDLSFRGGYGQCDCPHWQTRVWVVIRDGQAERWTRQATCHHVRAALKAWRALVLPAWIRYHGQAHESP